MVSLPRQPTTVGRYEIVAPLAAGGMATVFLGRVRGLGGFERRVAIKLMHPHLGQDPSMQRYFMDEARLAARLHHPNVVPVTDVGHDDAGLFLVMDYIEGASLAELLRAGRLPRDVSLRIACDLLEGLHAAHELKDDGGQNVGLIHRDVSPANILVGVDGVARLTDFGIARARSRVGHTKPGLVRGKLPYMAPEQASGAALDRRADVWAAGCVLWEMLAGRRLYDDEDDSLLLLRLLEGAPPPLSAVIEDLPRGLGEALAGALTKPLEQRHATARAFRRALLDAVEPNALASSERVAELVLERCGETIAMRRGSLGSEPPSAKGRPDDTPTAVAGPGAAPVEEADEPVMNTVTGAPALRSKRAATAKLALGALGLMTIVGSLAFWRRSATRDHASEAREAAVLSAASASAVVPAPAAAANAIPPPAPRETTRQLTIRANVPLKRIHIGDERHEVEPPKARTTIVVPTDQAVHLEAIAFDGQRLTRRVESERDEVTLSFASRPAPAVRSAPSPAKASSSTLPALPDSPYR